MTLVTASTFQTQPWALRVVSAQMILNKQANSFCGICIFQVDSTFDGLFLSTCMLRER